MKASVIIPIYNVEKYIKECLDSLYNKEFCDFEVICIDDKGQDNSISIIKEYVKDNKINNLKIIEHEKNKGLSETRNTGINVAQGDYIVFLDSDDMINANNLNNMLNHAEENNLDIVEGAIKEISETDLNIKLNNSKNRNNTEIISGDEYFSRCYKLGEYMPMVWCRIYKSKYIKGRFLFTSGLKFEDEEFSPRVIISANRVQYLDKEIYVYRRRNDSITTNMVKDVKWVNHYLIIIDNLFKYSETIKNKISYNALKNLIGNLALSILKNPLAYSATEDVIKQTILIIEKEKIYKIPEKSKNMIIKIQGILMKYPKIFIKLYKMRGK